MPILPEKDRAAVPSTKTGADLVKALDNLAGGLTGKMIVKSSDENYEFEFVDPQSGPQGDQGIQGIQGVAGNDGADGTNGTNGTDGSDGSDGSQGIQGIQGVKGDTGDTGPIGPAAVAGEIPSEYVEVLGPQSTVSAVLEDVPGVEVTINLDEPVNIAVMSSFNIATQTGSSATTIAISMSIDGVDQLELPRYLSGTNDEGIGSYIHRSDAPLIAGLHVIKLRFRRVSGVSTPGIANIAMLAMAMQSAIGPEGQTGATPTDFIDQNGGNNKKVWTGTQAEYDLLTPDVDTLYFIKEA